VSELKDLRAAAQHEMVLSEDAPREKVVAYLQQLQADVERLQSEMSRINKYQTLFKVCIH
jgi:prefoldin subunit 5